MKTALLLWFATTAVAFFHFQDYQTTGGEAGIAPSRWPRESQLEPDPDRNTLLLFAHPACPCTRATVEELNRLLARGEGRMTAHVLLLSPHPLPSGWHENAMRKSLSTIPGVTVHDDRNGIEAERFGAHTSGQVLVYDRSGRLVFSGGITAARGHVGDNAGSAAVLASLDGRASSSGTPVFGCSLQDRPVHSEDETEAR